MSISNVSLSSFKTPAFGQRPNKPMAPVAFGSIIKVDTRVDNKLPMDTFEKKFPAWFQWPPFVWFSRNRRVNKRFKHVAHEALMQAIGVSGKGRTSSESTSAGHVPSLGDTIMTEFVAKENPEALDGYDKHQSGPQASKENQPSSLGDTVREWAGQNGAGPVKHDTQTETAGTAHSSHPNAAFTSHQIQQTILAHDPESTHNNLIFEATRPDYHWWEFWRPVRHTTFYLFTGKDAKKAQEAGVDRIELLNKSKPIGTLTVNYSVNDNADKPHFTAKSATFTNVVQDNDLV